MPTQEELLELSKKNPGQTQVGETNSAGQRFEAFTPNIINSDVLTPAPAIDFSNPQYTPVYPVAGLNAETPTLQPTTPEMQVDEATKRIQSLNERLLGQSAFRAEQEQAQKIPELQKTQTDLTSQLKALQAEAQAIPLQLQNEAQGRGITAGGLAPIQTGKLRENAIKALTVSSLLESSRGNLATAQTLVDRAVAQKYDPIKEEIEVKTKNLELILKSPAYDLATKNRAQAQLDIQNKKKEDLEKKKIDDKSILDTALEAAKNGADALTLQKIQQAKTPIEAIQAAIGFLDSDKETGFTLSPGQVRYDAQGNVLGIVPEKPTDITTNDYKNYQLAGGQTGTGKTFNEWLQQNKNVGGTDMTPQQISTFNQIVGKYNASPLIAASDRTIVLKNTINQIKNDPNNGTLQLNLVYSYIQALDTYQSAVREGELGLVNSIDSTYGKLKNTVEKIQNGQIVRPEVAKQIAAAAESLVSTISEGAKRKAKSFESQATVSGVGDAWQQYISGFEQGFNIPQTQDVMETYRQMRANPVLIPQIQSAEKEGYTPEQIVDYLKKKSNTVSSIKLGSPLAIANNNPGNLRYVGQAGATKGRNGFARFATPEAGVKALQNQIALDASRGLTVEQFINKYAPPSENDTELYINQFIKALNANRKSKIAQLDLDEITKFMAKKESSTIIG